MRSLPRAQRLFYTLAGSVFLLAGAFALAGGGEGAATVERYQEAVAFRDKAVASLIRLSDESPAADIPENAPVYLEGRPGVKAETNGSVEDPRYGVRFTNPEVAWYVSVKSGQGSAEPVREAPPLHLCGVEVPTSLEQNAVTAAYGMMPTSAEILLAEPGGGESSIESEVILRKRNATSTSDGDVTVYYDCYMAPDRASALGAVKDGKLVPYDVGPGMPERMSIFRTTAGSFDPSAYLASKLTVAPPPEDLLARERNRRKIFAPLLLVIGLFFWLPVLRGWLRRDQEEPRL